MPQTMSRSSLSNHPFPNPWSNLSQQEIRKLTNGLARLLDARWTIPGTNVTIGLDPLIGLIPGIGDLLGNAIGSFLLILAAKAGVPRVVIVRMGLNVCLNMAMGAIPVVGDVLSIWFKSNLRNALLLDRHCQRDQQTIPLADWVYVLTILGLLFLLMAGILIGVVWALVSLVKWVSDPSLSSLP